MTLPENESSLADSQGSCSYCGGALEMDFYFCRFCATPYKNPEAVLLPPKPKHLSVEKLVAIKAPSARPMVLAYVGTILFAGVLSCILFQNDRPELAVVLSDACILITTCIFGTLHWRCLAPQLRQTGLGHWETYVGILALAPMLLGNYLYFMFLTEMMNAPTTNFLEQIREQGSAFYLITLCVFPALTEEIAFRGLLQQWLQVAVTPVRALVIASALFSALHFSVLSAPYIFLLGLILGWTKLKTGSIYPAMAIHFLHNFIVVEWF